MGILGLGCKGVIIYREFGVDVFVYCLLSLFSLGVDGGECVVL